MSGSAGFELDAALGRRWREYLSLLRACRLEPSETAVHDLRVSARRLLGALDVIRAVEPRPRLRRLRRAVKGILDALDDLRDVQVMLLGLSKTAEAAPPPASFVARLHRRERRLLARARAGLKGTRPGGLRKGLRKMGLRLREASEDADAEALKAVDRLFRRSTETAARVADPDPVSIHLARIAFKKFRYAAEVVEPFTPFDTSDRLKRMHAYQARLGDIHDVDVLLAELDRFERKISPPGSPAPIVEVESLRNLYRDRRLELMLSYHQAQPELGTLWRRASDQRFPWEVNNDPVYRPPRDRGTGGPAGAGGRGQPAPAHRQGTQEDVPHCPGPQDLGGDDRLDRQQPVPARPPDGPDPGQAV